MLKTLKEHDWLSYGLVGLAFIYAMSSPVGVGPNSPNQTPPSETPGQLPSPAIPIQPDTLPSPSQPIVPPSIPDRQPETPTPSPRPNNPPPSVPPPNSSIRSVQDLYNLFANLQSPGVNAIAAAEGNRYPDGRNTPLYERGHVDPGNGKFNRGWCSDQGRGKDNAEADRLCLERTRSRMDRITNLFKQAGLNATQYPEAWVNALDLWNQARPDVSDQFPAKYAQALREGRTGTAAILNARVEAFRRNGQIDAAGLLRICQRSPSRAVLSPWMCVATDQARRIRMIRAALRHAKVIP